MKQYLKGSAFIKSLYEEGGKDLANLPLQEYPLSMKEIEEPELYIERTQTI